MPGYLDKYGEGDELREKARKRTILIVLAALVAVTAVYLGVHNFREKGRVRDFLAALERQDYPSAYAMWGCSESKPCADYKFEKFLEDWGPGSKYARVRGATVHRSCACGSGVIITVRIGPEAEEKLWVEGPDRIIGFAPWPSCRPTPLLCRLPL
jgi:hypothetical protein